MLTLMIDEGWVYPFGCSWVVPEGATIEDESSYSPNGDPSSGHICSLYEIVICQNPPVVQAAGLVFKMSIFSSCNSCLNFSIL